MSLQRSRNSAAIGNPRERFALQRTWEKAVGSLRASTAGRWLLVWEARDSLHYPRCVPQSPESSVGRRGSEQQVRPQAPRERGDTARKGLEPVRLKRFSTCGSRGRVLPAQLAIRVAQTTVPLVLWSPPPPHGKVQVGTCSTAPSVARPGTEDSSPRRGPGRCPLLSFWLLEVLAGDTRSRCTVLGHPEILGYP